MSTTTSKRPLAEALKDAQSFRDLFEGHYSRWMIAGSVRRQKPEVADIEHVVIIGPTFWKSMESLLDPGGMFPDPASPLSKHVYKMNHKDGTITDQFRWGDKYRGADFRGFNHEVFTADEDNWGAILAIRTGPAEYSEHLVTVIQRKGLKQADGYVVYKSGDRYKVPTEQSFFDACGVPFVEPRLRKAP